MSEISLQSFYMDNHQKESNDNTTRLRHNPKTYNIYIVLCLDSLKKKYNETV